MKWKNQLIVRLLFLALLVAGQNLSTGFFSRDAVAQTPSLESIVTPGAQYSWFNLIGNMPDDADQSVSKWTFMEAQLAPRVEFLHGRERVGFVFEFRNELRRYDLENYDKYDSKPVLTPSYNPGLMFYFKKRHMNHQALGLGLYHYSNGQEDDFYLEGDCGEKARTAYCIDGRLINLRSGNFSTNYPRIEYLQSHFTRGAIRHLELGAEYHLYGYGDLGEEALQGEYGRFHVTAKMQVESPFKSRQRWDKLFVEARLSRIMNVSVTYHRRLAKEIYVRVHAHYGNDNYNLRFKSSGFGMVTGLSTSFSSSN